MFIILLRGGYDICGVDAVAENIDLARRLHPEVGKRVSVADMRITLEFPSESFDFVICNTVIQHINPRQAMGVTIPELCRVLRRGGVLQLMFKNGRGTATAYDRDYGVERSFQLYDDGRVLRVLERQGMDLIQAEAPGALGGFMYFTDPKPMDHCVLFARKTRLPAAA